MYLEYPLDFSDSPIKLLPLNKQTQTSEKPARKHLGQIFSAMFEVKNHAANIFFAFVSPFTWAAKTSATVNMSVFFSKDVINICSVLYFSVSFAYFVI